MPTSTELIEAMQIEARVEILSSTEWLTADQIAALALEVGMPLTSTPDEWLKEGRLFAIHVVGQYRFPYYGLDPVNGYQPLPAMAGVLATLDRRSGWSQASWFAGLNSWLGSYRPMDMIATQPERVMDAAQIDRLGIQHG